MTGTRDLIELAASLRYVADLFEAAADDLGELPAPVHLTITAHTGYAGHDEERRATVDLLAKATGVSADWNKNLGGNDHGYWETGLSPDGEPWTLHVQAYLPKPDPAEEMRVENERLRARLAELEGAS